MMGHLCSNDEGRCPPVTFFYVYVFRPTVYSRRRRLSGHDFGRRLGMYDLGADSLSKSFTNVA